jgi:DNA-binding CsgD family transcriptional regulator
MTHEHKVLKSNDKVGWQQWTNRAIYSNEGTLNEYQSVGRDITDRKEAEIALLKRENELEEKTQSLEELNTALKVLLEKRQEDKIQGEEKILTNIRELVKPYLEKLKHEGLNRSQKTYMDIVESNLDEIVSPFTFRMSSNHLNLTPTEIQVANLIKQGKRSKEIAELIHASPKTIAIHRGSIRKKLGLQNKKINLRAYLLSVPDNNA